ncbi:MAG: hypothetical protein K0R49_1591 [Burkholderiales bacterium]|jgi:hypothetical protein|nr:hypothetical protein [Burkholderiales bacterium]
MTLIISVLAKDFALIASDKLAKATGSQNLIIDSIKVSIIAAKEITINGFKKIYLNKNATVAVAIAGDAHAHSYINKTSNIEDIDLVLSEIMTHTQNFNTIINRDINTLTDLTSNSGFAVFYDNSLSTFLSLYYDFSKISSTVKLWKSSDAAGFCYSGSGSPHIFQAKPEKEINAALAQVKDFSDVNKMISLLSDIYNGVSILNHSVSKDFEFFVATKENPFFHKLIA